MAMLRPLHSLVVLAAARVGGALDVDVEKYGCTAGGPVCTAGFAAAVSAASAAPGGGTVHARGPGAYTVGGIEMLSRVTLQVHA
eukprot:gene7486-19807_t